MKLSCMFCMLQNAYNTARNSERQLLCVQVVLMNQVTTKVLGNNQGSKLVPALGANWTKCLLTSLMGSALGAKRTACLFIFLINISKC